MVDEAIQVQHRRGTRSEIMSSTPADGEFWYNKTNNSLHIGNGVQAGGYELPNVYSDQANAYRYAAVAGTANAIELNLSPIALAYTEGMGILFKAGANNSGSVTVNVNGLGTRNLVNADASQSPLSSGSLIAGVVYSIIYNGTSFQLLGGGGGTSINSVGRGQLKISTASYTANLSGFSSGIISEKVVFGGVGMSISGGYGFNLVCGGFTSSGTNNTTLNLTGVFVSPNNNIATIGIFDSSFNGNSNRSGSATVTENYVTSSPPYNLGDGDVGGFIYLLLDESNNIVSHVAADTPPWAYNGPTDITAKHECPITKKRFRYVPKTKCLKSILNGAPSHGHFEEVTNELKNADMGLIPHPFMGVPAGHKVVLLDPMSDKVQRMIDYQNMTGSMELADLIMGGHIIIDDKCSRKCPRGVTPVKFKFKG